MKRHQWFSTINILVAIILVNLVLNYYHFWRLDLTANRIHSLSSSTKKIVKELPDLVNIKVFLTQDLPPEAKTISTYLKTILEEIARLNRNKLKVVYIDPNQDEGGKLEAERLGIQPLQFSTVKSDKFEIQTGYLGLVLSYGDKDEVLPVASDTGNLEYFLMSAIKKLISQKLPTVAIVNEATSETEILQMVLGKSYQIVDEKDAGVILWVNPKTKIESKRIKEIEGWLSSGKGLIVLMDKVAVGAGLQSSPTENKELGEILKKYGVEAENKLVLDQSSMIANFRSQNGTFLTKYPYWVVIRPENINSQLPVTSGLSSLMLAWASPLKLSGEAKELFSSSPTSMAEENPNLAPGAGFPENGEAKKEVLGAINTDGVKLAVVGDSDLVKDQFVINSQQNLALVLNLVDYFSQETDLMAIRSKEMKSSPIREVNDKTKTIIKGINVAAPIMVLVLSMVIFRIWRKNANKKSVSDR